MNLFAAILLEKQGSAIVTQNAEQFVRSVGRPKSITTQVAEATGLSDDTVRRALNPKPAADVIPISARSEEDVVLAQANAIIAAWNRACPKARSIAMDTIDTPVFDKTRAGA